MPREVAFALQLLSLRVGKFIRLYEKGQRAFVFLYVGLAGPFRHRDNA